MVGLDGIKRRTNGDHAVPSPVRLKVARVRLRHRMSLLISAEIGNEDRRTIGSNPENAIRGIRYPVRATASGGQRIKGVTDEGDVGHAADEAAEPRLRLAGWE